MLFVTILSASTAAVESTSRYTRVALSTAVIARQKENPQRAKLREPSPKELLQNKIVKSSDYHPHHMFAQ